MEQLVPALEYDTGEYEEPESGEHHNLGPLDQYHRNRHKKLDVPS